MKKKLLTFTLCAALTICACAGGYLNKNRYIRLSFKDIRESYMTQSEMSVDNISNSISTITQKSKAGKKLTLEEEFLLTYNLYMNGEYEAAIEKAKYINENINKNTNTFVKIYNSNMLINLLIANEEYDECMNVFNKILNNLSNKEKEKFLNEVILIVDSVKYTIPGNVSRAIEIFEDIVEHNKVDEINLLKIKSKLSALYIFNGNYARTIEKCYEIISIAEEKQLTDENELEYNQVKYYERLAKADLGVINGMLGNNNTAREWFLKSLDLKVDEEQAAIESINTLYNLHSVSLSMVELDELIKIHEEINRLSQYLPEEEKEKIKNYNYILRAQYYIQNGDIEQSEKLINKTLEILESGGKLNDYAYSPCYFSIAWFYYLKGDYKEAEKRYLELLDLSMKISNNDIMKRSLQDLIDVYSCTNDYEKMFMYTNQLKEIYDQGTNSINEEYAEYAIYKYNSQKLLVDEYDKKIKTYATSFIVILLSILSAIITYLKYKELIRTSRRDVLTKCYNRRYFDLQYNNLINKKKDFALILFDIDNFKKINDDYGHAVGDAVLIGIVEHINKRFDNKINLFRYGGEEFAILIEKSSKEKMYNEAEIIRKAIENIIWKYRFKITISMGAFFSDSGNEEINVFEKADQNLYISKNTGKNKVTI